MAKHGLPVFPIYDDMPVEANASSEEIEWMIGHGTIYRSIDERLFKVPKSRSGLPLVHQNITKYQGEYVFVATTDKYKGDDPQCDHYVARKYSTLKALIMREQTNIAETGLEAIGWYWMDYRLELLEVYGEEVVYSV